MAKITEIKSDMEKVEKGKWFDYALGIKLLIANIHNSKYRKMRTRLLRPHQRRLKSMSGDETLEILKPAIAKHLLIGWRNIEDEKGNEIPYSSENALEFFNDPSLADLFTFVIDAAGENTSFAIEQQEEEVKN